MNDTIKELLDEFPELKEDSEKLEKVVNYLESSKPNVEASMEFKDSLRKRLDNIIESREGKKKNLLKILIPSFAFCFIIALVFVYYKDFTSYDNKGQNLEDLNQNVFYDEIDMISTGGGDGGEMIDEKNTQIEEVELSVNNTNSSGLNLNDTSENSLLDTITIEGDNNFDQSVFPEIENELGDLDGILLGTMSSDFGDTRSLSSDIPQTGTAVNVSVNDEMTNVMNLLDELVNGVSVSNTADNGKSTEDSGVYSFEDFCKLKVGIIVNTSDGRSCRIKGEECLEKDFNPSGSCEFVPLN